jgi:antibiotic biosynthesis monooxygenase (ABM) superfamily enzyme
MHPNTSQITKMTHEQFDSLIAETPCAAEVRSPWRDGKTTMILKFDCYDEFGKWLDSAAHETFCQRALAFVNTMIFQHPRGIEGYHKIPAYRPIGWRSKDKAQAAHWQSF